MIDGFVIRKRVMHVAPLSVFTDEFCAHGFSRIALRGFVKVADGAGPTDESRAVTLWSDVRSFTTHAFCSMASQPVHMIELACWKNCGRSVTVLPGWNAALQLPGQRMPGGSLCTEPIRPDCRTRTVSLAWGPCSPIPVSPIAVPVFGLGRFWWIIIVACRRPDSVARKFTDIRH
jgi:hypothetical protein